MAEIVDSGNRTEFKSGAVRDVQEGKGRCDLMPIPEVAKFFESYKNAAAQKPLYWVDAFEQIGEPIYLIYAAASFARETYDDPYTAILEYAKHLEDGCKKYGARNWEKGIPLERYVDSGIRHYMKVMREDDDERHDRAFLWNMLCGAATCRMHPDLNTFPVEKNEEEENV